MNISKVVLTQDGSHTLFNKQSGEHYHSIFGAIQESKHIFIDAGLEVIDKEVKTIHILEIGLGTGLNTLLSMQWAEANGRRIDYTGLEAFPPEIIQLKSLNYPHLLKMDKVLPPRFYSTESKQKLSPSFHFKWIHQKFEGFYPEGNYYHLIYFDAFSPEVQPEMWTEEGFLKLYKSLKTGGILTTYSCKGMVKRALKAAGFQIEKLPGPPGKREFLRARVPVK